MRPLRHEDELRTDMSATGLAMDIEERLEQAIENDVDYADPGLTRLLKDALEKIRELQSALRRLEA